ncbi:Pleiotropic regulator 1 [Halotydeus destructor]|nr:Pleiotropic regulator 1 [Halotydeus destructor]
MDASPMTPIYNRPAATPHRSAPKAPPVSKESLEFDPSVITKHSVHTLVFRSLKRAHDLFVSNEGQLPPLDDEIEEKFMSIKARDQYGPIMHLVPYDDVKGKTVTKTTTVEASTTEGGTVAIVKPVVEETEYKQLPLPGGVGPNNQVSLTGASGASAIIPRKANSMPKPGWHAPWKLMRVVSGHTGWVRCIAVEPGNEWFASGSNDRIIKIWDLASGKLKLSLTGHISGVRGLAVSQRQPYLFSCGEDKTVKCWDLEYNKVIRHYHGHLSGVYTIALHPTIDILVTGGRDSSARVWDMRTKAQIHGLSGHSNTISSVVVQASEPQIITGSHDSTVRLWDLVAGKTRVTLTHHKKSVRAVALHPRLNMFASGAADHIKEWTCPDGKFVQNLDGHNAIVNCLAANTDGVLVSGGDNGSMHFWDWRTGYNFQRIHSAAQPGSLESEAWSVCHGLRPEWL